MSEAFTRLARAGGGSTMVFQLLRRRLTVDEFHRMGQAGILTEDDRVELLDGELVMMSPIGSRHAASVKRSNHVFVQRGGGRVVVGVQDPIRIGEHSEPQPDLVLLRLRADYYAGSHPEAQDILLVVEVADTSAEVDREVKGLLYARAGIPEMWLANLVEDCLEVFRAPTPDGYAEVRRFRRGERVSPLALPDLVMAVEEILG
jgi:Uma2 family endonuclease